MLRIRNRIAMAETSTTPTKDRLFAEKFISEIENRKLSDEITSEMQAELDLNKRLHEGTLLTVLGWSGEPGMDMHLLRSIIYKHLTLKQSNIKL